MNMGNSIEIDAPASLVWDIYTDVERWPEWTASIEHVKPLDGPGLAIGKRFEIKQPKFPKVVWEVTALDRGSSWTWRQHSPGATSTATHEVVAQESGGTLVHQRVEQRGPVGVVVGLLTKRLTRRYLDLEAQGLKASGERRRRRDASRA